MSWPARLLLGLLVLIGPVGAVGASVPAPLAQDDGPNGAVRGSIRDGDGEPVPDGIITVRTAEGEVVAEATTDATGAWEVEVASPGTFEAELDTATLPTGVTLRDPDRNPLAFELRPAQTRTLVFALGERDRGGAGFSGRLAQQLLGGLQFGLIIAMTAIGLSLIYATTGLVNFAHGELVTLGAVVAWFLNAPPGIAMHLVPAGLLAVVLTAAAGGTLERGLWRPLRRRGAGVIQMLVISIGLSLLLRNVLQIWFGGRSRPYVDYTIQSSFSVGPVSLTPRDAVIVGLAVLTLVAVATMLQRSRLGKAMRAVADDRDLAAASGIDVPRVILGVWIVGAGLAGFGGVLAAVDENVTFLLGFRLLLLMFAAVVLGGLGTAYGAMAGALVIGLVVEGSTLWFSPELKYVWALLALILILLVRPQGLLGRRERVG